MLASGGYPSPAEWPGGRFSPGMPAQAVSFDMSCATCCGFGPCCEGVTLPSTIFATIENWTGCYDVTGVGTVAMGAIDPEDCVYKWTGGSGAGTVTCADPVENLNANFYLECCGNGIFAPTAEVPAQASETSQTLIGCDPFELLVDFEVIDECCDPDQLITFKVRYTE